MGMVSKIMKPYGILYVILNNGRYAVLHQFLYPLHYHKEGKNVKAKDSITIKILFSTSLCLILFTFFGIFGASALYGSRLSQRSRQINEQYLSVIQNQLEADIAELQKLSGLCAGSFPLMEALRYSDMESVAVRKKCLEAQNSLDAFASSTPLTDYLKRFAILTQNGMHISASVGDAWTDGEWQALHSYLETDAPVTPTYYSHPLSDASRASRLSFLAPLSTISGAYLYVELNETILSDQLLPYQDLQKIYILNRDTGLLLTSFLNGDRDALPIEFLKNTGSRLQYMGHSYLVSSLSVSQFSLSVGCLSDMTLYTGDNLYILYILLILLLTTAVVGILVTRLLTRRITRPIQVLTGHIRKISETNDFSENPAIEASSDEIGEIGKAINQMTRHIRALLTQQAEMYEQKKNTEIALLQSQINPHFLYNTLDSIRWMAVIQGSKNIEQITSSLAHLLRNIAKGIGDKIPLREELSLVRDYIHIQQVRYVESFDYICQVPEELLDCTIVKLTLQPIVENAILHGIEPTGRFGEIEISAYEQDNELFLSIEDNGAGMTPDELARLQSSLSNSSKSALSGIGVANVDARLKLHYGPGYGLICESSPDEFTRITIHIPKEVPSHVQCTDRR